MDGFAGRRQTIASPPESVSHRLAAFVDPTFEQQILNVPHQQREANIHHHDQGDDLRGRVKIAEWARCTSEAGHAPLLTFCRGKRQPVHLL